jgi:hypothetical protein
MLALGQVGVPQNWENSLAVFNAPIMAVIFDPLKPLKTGQASAGAKLTLYGTLGAFQIR